jgi:hypothetical protein
VHEEGARGRLRSEEAAGKRGDETALPLPVPAPRLPRAPSSCTYTEIGRLKRAGFSSPILLISATSSSVSEMTLKFDSMRDGVTDLGMTAEARPGQVLIAWGMHGGHASTFPSSTFSLVNGP